MHHTNLYDVCDDRCNNLPLERTTTSLGICHAWENAKTHALHSGYKADSSEGGGVEGKFGWVRHNRRPATAASAVSLVCVTQPRMLAKILDALHSVHFPAGIQRA